ncbi:hypothetical protein ACJJTC_016078 [Scirpophaga incertulas]
MIAHDSTQTVQHFVQSSFWKSRRELHRNKLVLPIFLQVDDFEPLNALVTVVQRRWKNLRACFSRELRSQKEVKSGQAAPKRKHYVYYEKLLFLIPSMDQPNETFSNAATAPVSEDNEALGEDESSSSSTVTRRAQEKKKKNITYE